MKNKSLLFEKNVSGTEDYYVKWKKSGTET